MQAKPWQMAVLPATVVGNLLITSLIFWVITRSYDARPKVPATEMFWLISASALLNYLPLRPGLLGRAAYLKLKYDLPVRQSVLILLIVLVLGAAVLLGAAAVVVIVPVVVLPVVGACATLVATVLVWGVAPRILRRPIEAGWSWVPLRLLDLSLGTLRLWVAFAVVGHAVGWADAIVLAAAGMLIAMAGLTPNGLGLREWAIGLLAGMMGKGDPEETFAIAAAAALVDRAIEAIVVAIVGSFAMTRVRIGQDNAAAVTQPPIGGNMRE
jgi:hypothetical protein